LRGEGAIVVPVVRKKSEARDKDSIEMDLTSGSESLLNAVDIKPDTVIHLAAAVPHSATYPDTEVSADKTRLIDHTIWSACNVWNIRCLYASTCGLYDPLEPQQKTEDSHIKVRSPYFAAKVDGEELFGGRPENCIFRLAAPYGPGMQASLVLVRFVSMAVNGQTIEIWGSGKREQDFISVNDVAGFIVRALIAEARGVYNVASGVALSMASLARLVVDVVGKGDWCFSGQSDPQDSWTARYDVSKARRELHWSPAEPLANGIAQLVDILFDLEK
jgi:nucleoside-diphosphate-sugar epimerase